MKTIAFILALFCQNAVYSAHYNNEDSLSKKIVTAFNAAFSGAKYISAEPVENQKELVKITFEHEDEIMFAFYNQGGELIALSRKIKLPQLPIRARLTLEKKTRSRYLTGLFEISQNGETNYYATIKDDEWSMIYVVDESGTWTLVKKSKREQL
jgi:hypothetical protein